MVQWLGSRQLSGIDKRLVRPRLICQLLRKWPINNSFFMETPSHFLPPRSGRSPVNCLSECGFFASIQKGASPFASPLLLRVGSDSFQRAPAVAVNAGVTTLTLICFGFASSRFGMLRVNTPFLYSALIASEFTVFASEKLRLKEP